MKTVIYLTVRLKSKRLPEKALRMVGNQTIIEHIIDRARAIRSADEIVLCTSTNDEDTPLLAVAEKKGIPAFRGSEDDLTARFLAASEIFKPDVVVRMTGDNCLISPEYMDDAIEQHIKNAADFTSTKELAGGSRGDVFSLDALRRLSTMLQDARASEYLSWLLADERYFKVQWLGVDEALRRPQYRLHCDTPEDLEFIRAVYDRLYDGRHIVDYRSVIELLDRSPEIVAINGHVQQRSRDFVKDQINIELKPSA